MKPSSVKIAIFQISQERVFFFWGTATFLVGPLLRDIGTFPCDKKLSLSYEMFATIELKIGYALKTCLIFFYFC